MDHPCIRRKNGAEEPLKTYETFQKPEKMKNSVFKKVLCGVSARDYEEAIESVRKNYGVKKSCVSRHFVQATSQQLEKFLERRLEELDILVMMMDGSQFKGEHFIVVLGVDTDGKKHILGFRQGSSENRSICLELLNDLDRRGLDTQKRYLFMLDGSKALRSAVAQKFGGNAEVKRCEVHKRRNIRDHLQPEHQEEFDRRSRNAYNMTGYSEAKKSLDLVVRQLRNLNPSAERSLEEGLEETLTLHRLGITGTLRKTLSTTNMIESCFSRVRTVTRRVKRWRKGNMMERWICASLLHAERKFRRIRGYKDGMHK